MEEGIVSEGVAQRWFEHFNTREGNTKDLQRSGSPNLWYIEHISRVLEENPQKRLEGCQKNFVHQKIPYIVRLRHSTNHIEAVGLYLMN